MDRQSVHDIIHEISRKLLLVEGERKAAERKKIIDSIIVDENGELEQLKKLLNLGE